MPSPLTMGPTANPARAEAPPQTRTSLAADLGRLGVRPGDVLLVHCSMRRIGWVLGGAVSVVRALCDRLGPDGTLVTPALTTDNSDPSRWERMRRRSFPEAMWDEIRANLPPFDPHVTPSVGMGAVAEAVRTWPGSVRSAHPQTSFAALGRDAGALMADHDIRCHYGAHSPLARLRESGAKVLLLGVGWDVCTAFHHAEYALPRTARTYGCAIEGPGGRQWFEYEDIVLDDADFNDLGRALAATRPDLVRRGRVGEAPTLLVEMAPAIAFAVDWLREHRAAAT